MARIMVSHEKQLTYYMYLPISGGCRMIAYTSGEVRYWADSNPHLLVIPDTCGGRLAMSTIKNPKAATLGVTALEHTAPVQTDIPLFRYHLCRVSKSSDWYLGSCLYSYQLWNTMRRVWVNLSRCSHTEHSSLDIDAN